MKTMQRVYRVHEGRNQYLYSQKYKCNLDGTFRLTILAYGRTRGAFVWIFFLTLYCLCLQSFSHLKRVIVNGTALLAQKDDVTADGLQKTFATNVFGHFLMVRVFCDVIPVCHLVCIVLGTTVGEKIVQSN